MKSVDEVIEVTECANKIFKHRYDDYCLIRIGLGNTPKNFKCRKLYTARDSPDPTKNSYVPIRYSF